MKMTFRWYGKDDKISLKQIKQIPNVTGVVTAIYDKAVGEVWKCEEIRKLKQECEKSGLELEVIESVPVHEDIKLGKPTRDKLIENYKQTILNLGKEGIKVICYNFMPVFDWVRTNLKTENQDGSNSLSYSDEEIRKLNPKELHLPGWDESYSIDELNDLLAEYKNITHEKLFENLVYFLNKIMPSCEEAGINMAIHPDDPPWDIFGLPRIMVDEISYDNLIKYVPNSHNGFTFCTGSLGANRKNDLPHMAKKYAKRIFFAHVRQIKYVGETDFIEVGHNTEAGSLDIYKIVKSLIDGGFDGYIRPDHGRNIWDEEGKPGYGLYDRALGAAYINGLYEAIKKGDKER